ncbi:MAG: HAMP domain-containing sensor histidine kinase [Porticoccaceae bacterium]
MKPTSLLGRLTLLQQWAGATILAVIPLLVAVSYAAIALQHQTSAQRRLVQDMDELISRTAALGENTRDLVRSARQYLLLRDDSFLELYRQKTQAMDGMVEVLQGAMPEPDNRRHLLEMRAMAMEVGSLMAADLITPEELSPRIQLLTEHTDALLERTAGYRRAALRKGEMDFNRIVDQLFLFTLMALPGTFLLMIVGTFMVSRPIWRLSQAIKGLGRQQWDAPIHVGGPADLVALGESLEWMRQQVLAGDRQKMAFIQHVTHELKTPLAAIIEAGNLLQEGVAGDLNGEQSAVLGILRSNARNLEELIQQMLNYNAVSHGMMTHLMPVDIRSLCESIRSGLETAAPGKIVHWHIVGDPPRVASDARLLEMILKNLVGNAFYFSASPGEITVTWAVEGDHWLLAVIDRGPGIDADEFEHIFTPFYKGLRGRLDTAPRNGIGLAIVHESVKLLGGKIDVESAPGMGATFRLTLPFYDLEEST